MGADRTVADYRQILAYFRALDAASPRVEVEVLGKTTLGEELFLAAISSEANLANKKRLQEIARRSPTRGGSRRPRRRRSSTRARSSSFVTCNIHSTEIGASQMAMEWAHALATAEDAETKRRLDQVVLLLLPSINPDGQIMETEWYRKNLGTPLRGRPHAVALPPLHRTRQQPRLVHADAEGDAGRLTAPLYHEWLPQVWLDEHQMGSTGPRIFMPPYADPVDPDIHPLVWRDVNLIGANMYFRLEQAGKSGVIYGYVFDAYWPGGTKNTAWWKNVSGLLTEVASAALCHPDRRRAERARRGREGARRVRHADELPEPVAGGDVAPARHHGLRADRLGRDPGDVRGRGARTS